MQVWATNEPLTLS